MKTSNKNKVMKIKAIFKDLGEKILDFILPLPPSVHKMSRMSPAEFLEEASSSEFCQYANTILNYRHKLVRDLIWEIKYRGNSRFVRLASVIIYDHLIEILSEESEWSNFKNPILIPMSISKKRLVERGFNQCELLSEGVHNLDKGQNFSYKPKLLLKIRHTESQTKTHGRSERLENLKDCFEVKNKAEVLGKNIILLDDVVTTGATVTEAKKALKKAGAKRVLVVALAH